MSKFMQSLLKKKAEVSTKIQDRFQGESYLYMGDPSLNWGVGGWVRGKANLIYGPHKCLSADTWVNYQVIDENGKRQNHKGGTIERLYHRFHGLKRPGKGNYQREVTAGSKFTITSFDENGHPLRNDIEDVMYSGVKECFELVTASGKTISTTADHRFLSNGEYVTLGDLKIGDNVSVFTKPSKKTNKAPYAKRKYLFVKYHHAKNYKMVKNGGKEYQYCRIGEHRAVIEAEMNNMTMVDYVSFLNTETQENIDKLNVLSKDTTVHHLNENTLDNRRENLQIMSNKEHHNLHFAEKLGAVSYITDDQIVSITPVGPKETYDIACKAPYNNFLAEGIVVHNSGKSTLALIAAGAEQVKTDGWIVIFDSEYAHNDPNEIDNLTGELSDRAKEAKTRYEACGIDTDRMLIIQSNEVDVLFANLPDFEKQARDGSLNISALLVDSWAGIQGETAKNKIEKGEIASAGNSFGGNAKVLGPVLQTLLRLSAENGISSFFIQHCIQNMEMYGSKWVLLGGEKLKYLVHSVTFVEFTQAKDSGLYEGDAEEGVRIGKKIRFRCEKSRKVVEGRTGEFFMNFKEVKFAKPEYSLFRLATNLGVIGHPRSVIYEKDGTTPKVDKSGKVEYKENKMYWEFPVGATSPYKFHGEKGMLEELRNNKELFDKVYKVCMETDKISALSGGESITEVRSV